MIKKIIIIGTASLTALLCVFLIYRYYQYILAWDANRKIDAHGIKLMMIEDEVRNMMGKEEEYIQGFGGYKLVYQSKGVSLTLLNDMGTDFYQKVSEISVSNKDYQIYGIKPGDSFDSALNIIHTQGFKEGEAGTPGYYKTNLFISLEKGDLGEVKSITIGIKDRVSSSRVY